MFFLLGLLLYGLVVGGMSKLLHPGPDPVGCLPTIIIGIVGSYVGGFLLFMFGKSPLGSMSGIIMGIVGGILSLVAWRWWSLRNAPSGSRKFWTGDLR